MFSHELEYIFNKEYREWWDNLMNSLEKPTDTSSLDKE